MRILFLTTYFQPDVAATGMLVSQLAEDLAEQGHQITVVTSVPHYDINQVWKGYRWKPVYRERRGKMWIYRCRVYVPTHKTNLPGRVLNFLSFHFLSTITACFTGRHDLIFTVPTPLTNGVEAYLLALLNRTPFIYNVQDILPDVAVRMGILKNQSLIRIFQKMERFIYRKAASVTVISGGMRDHLLQKGVPDCKLAVIPNFVDEASIECRPRSNSFSNMHDLDERYVVLYAGNVGLSQGLETLLEAAFLLAKVGRIQFLIVGNGTTKPTLVDRALKMELRNVLFLPYQPHEVIADMYATADLCIVPLKQGYTEESVPCKVFSILGAGRPMIASVDRDSDTWQFVQQAGCGLCVEPEDPQTLADAILTLYQNPHCAAEMGAAGQAFVKAGYTRRQISGQYEFLFQCAVKLATTNHGKPNKSNEDSMKIDNSCN